MGKGSRRLKSKPATSRSEDDMSVAEGHDFGGGESTSVADATGESALHTTIPAGTTLFMNVTQIQLTSGVGIGYKE